MCNVHGFLKIGDAIDIDDPSCQPWVHGVVENFSTPGWEREGSGGGEEGSQDAPLLADRNVRRTGMNLSALWKTNGRVRTPNETRTTSRLIGIERAEVSRPEKFRLSCLGPARITTAAGSRKKNCKRPRGCRRPPISPIALPSRIRISMRIRIGISVENTCYAAPPRSTNIARPRTMGKRTSRSPEIYLQNGIPINYTPHPNFSIAPFALLWPTDQPTGRSDVTLHVHLFIRRPSRVWKCIFPSVSLTRETRHVMKHYTIVNGTTNARWKHIVG